MLKTFTARPYLLYIPLGFLLYMGSLNGPFVFDDDVYIGNNPWIRSLRNFLDLSGVRYIGDLSFAINYALSGLEPFWYHATNIAVHILNAILVFHLVARIFETPAVKNSRDAQGLHPVHTATVVSALFLVHPVQTQAVSYISQRYTSLAAFFYLSSLLFYLNSRLALEGGKKGISFRAFYFCSLIAAALAMKVKEISFTLPFMIAFLEFGAFQRACLRGRILRLAPFFMTALLIPLSMLSGGGNAIDEMFKAAKLEDETAISRYDYLLTQSTVVVEYIRLLFFPADQHFDYYYPLHDSFLEPKVILSSAALLITIVAAFFMFARSRRTGSAFSFLFAFGLIWFFLALSVESSIIPIRDVINEHRVYLPGMGIMLSFTVLLFYANEKMRRVKGYGFRTATVAAIILAVLAPALSYATISRNAFWGDDISLYLDEISKNGFEASPRINLGNAFFKKNRFNEAASEYKKALKFNPDERRATVIHINLANVYIKLNLYDEAIDELLEVVKLKPKDRDAHLSLAILYTKKGLYSEAGGHLEEHLRVKPDDVNAKRALDFIRAGRGDELKILIK